MWATSQVDLGPDSRSARGRGAGALPLVDHQRAGGPGRVLRAVRRLPGQRAAADQRLRLTASRLACTSLLCCVVVL